MKLVLGIAGCLALAGCVSVRVEPFTTPDGQAGYIAHCGGDLFTMADCHREARSVCGGNYEEMNRSVTVRGLRVGATENRSFEFVCET